MSPSSQQPPPLPRIPSADNVTVFNLEIDASKEEKPPTLFELLPGEQIILRCNVTSGAHPSNPSLRWLLNGDRIENEGDHQDLSNFTISTSEDQLRSTLNITADSGNSNNFGDHSNGAGNKAGLFECSVRNLRGVRKSAKIKIERKFEESIKTNEEELCSVAHRAQCRHKSVCVYNKRTGFMSCKCPADYYGPSCQYAIIKPKTYLVNDMAVPPPQFDCQRDRQEYTRNLTIFGSVSIVVVLLLFVAIFLLLRRKSRPLTHSQSSKVSLDECEALNFKESECEKCQCGKVVLEIAPPIVDSRQISRSSSFNIPNVHKFTDAPIIAANNHIKLKQIKSFEDAFKLNRVKNAALS